MGVYDEILKLGALQRLVQRGSDSHRSGSHAVQIASEGIEILQWLQIRHTGNIHWIALNDSQFDFFEFKIQVVFCNL